MNSFTDLHPRVIRANPWNSIDENLNELLDKIILEVHPNILDDDIPDTLDDWDNREMAIEYLIDKLTKMKG